jgi:hypothetical protein
MRDIVVTLIRRFVPVASGKWESFIRSVAGPVQRWPQLEALYRVLVLAEPGAGKTFEALARARALREKGKAAFFIRIERIGGDFANAFEVGTAEEFDTWCRSAGEAWFFLDSVDEAQLGTPRAFEDAVRVFGTRIHDARERAHIYVTSREDAWQALSDHTLIEQHLPHGVPPEEAEGQGENAKSPTLKVFRLDRLNADEIKLFAAHCSVGDPNDFFASIERSDLMWMASRPFDLKALIGKWQADRKLGSRLEVMRRVVQLQLAPLSAFAATPKIDVDRVNFGARALAAAVTLTGSQILCMPDGTMSADRIDPRVVLPDWSAPELDALLRTGVFDDIVYGSVRFRHREIRELLTAEWAVGILQRPDGRSKVEALFFRSIYGQEVVVQRLRPALAWLILFDTEIRDRAMALEPEIATEGGDPSSLPLEIRRSVLVDIVERIAANRAQAPIMDNEAIARIAAADLSDEACGLLEKFGGSDDVIFFLGRFVWRGRITACVPALSTIAADNARGIYARVAAIRAVMTVGNSAQQNELWSSIAKDTALLDRDLLAELLPWAAPTVQNIDLLLQTFDRLVPYEEFKVTGLGEAIHQFIDGLPIMIDQAPEQHLARLAEGLNRFLNRRPHVEPGHCHVSSEFLWLVSPALHAVERLVAARASAALQPDMLAVLLKAPAVEYWRGERKGEYGPKLHESVPRWPELNDALYWASVAEWRVSQAAKGERVTSDHMLNIFRHFWRYGADDFDRCLSWVTSKPDLDDRLVALSRCATLYLQHGRRPDWRISLERAVLDETELASALASRLNPPANEEYDRWTAQEAVRKQERAQQDRKIENDRCAWVATLRADPDRVRRPPGLEPGAFSNDHYYLLLTILNDGSITSHEGAANWRALIPEFGEEVATAFRDAAIAHWRAYKPILRSEGADLSSTPYSLIFAMAGLAMEAADDPEFASALSPDEARRAFRYITWELNGFPSWFEALYRAHPGIGLEAVSAEVLWELEHSAAAVSLHRVLHNILYRAPWLHAVIAPIIYRWLSSKDMSEGDDLRHTLSVLQGGGMAPGELAALASEKLGGGAPIKQRPRWFALWVDNDPAPAISALEAELERFGAVEASEQAQQFAVALLGGRHGDGRMIGAFRTPAYLKALYVLMHRFVRAAEDIERAGKGVYSPTMRDDAQDARERLFRMLAETPGADAYAAIKALENDHPEPDHRPWMAARARERAIADADEPLWSSEDVHRFSA